MPGARDLLVAQAKLIGIHPISLYTYHITLCYNKTMYMRDSWIQCVSYTQKDLSWDTYFQLRKDPYAFLSCALNDYVDA